MNSVLISRFRNRFTSATLPTRPIIFRNSSSRSLKRWNSNACGLLLPSNFNKIDAITLTFRQPRKNSIPRPSKNRSQLTAVSSVTFHIVDQATSMTSSNTSRVSRSWMSVSIVCKIDLKYWVSDILSNTKVNSPQNLPRSRPNPLKIIFDVHRPDRPMN